MWYSYDKIFSYNAMYNFILSNRGGGKTFGAKNWAIKDFLKNEKQFIYVRRYKTEVGKIKNFFGDIAPYFPNAKFKQEGKLLKINGKVAGYLMPLSNSLFEKSNPFPQVNKIIFDEFIVDKGAIRYIKNEVETFLELHETVQRLRLNPKEELRVVFLANNISCVNPYFTYFKLKVNPNERFTIGRNGLIAVELFTDEEFIRAKQNTRFGQLIEGTKYGDYAISNKALRDSDTFIRKKKPIDSKFLFSFKYRDKEFGCWQSIKEGIIHFNYQIDNKSLFRYALTKDDHNPNFVMLTSMKRHSHIKYLIKNFELGCVEYSNQEVKQALYEIFNLLSIR